MNLGLGLGLSQNVGGASEPTSPPVIESTSETEQTSDATNIVVGAPSGIQDGDLLVAIVSTGDSDLVTHSAPAGWATLVDNETSFSANFGNALSVFTKVASSESGSYTFPYGATSRGSAQIFRISNATGANAGTAVTAGTSDIDVNSYTTTAAFSKVINVFSWTSTARTPTANPTQGTLILDSTPSASDTTCGAVVTYQQDVNVSGTSTTADTLTVSGGVASVGIPLEILAAS